MIDFLICRFRQQLLSVIWSHHSPNDQILSVVTFAMKCVLNINNEALKIIYDKEYDLDKYIIDTTGYHSLISFIAESDVGHHFKDTLLQILDNAKEMTIKLPINFCAGVCHWCCMYHDLEVAEKMYQTKNVQINRFDNEKKTGPF